MIKVMTINDYEELFELWINTPNMGLRSLDDSKEGISCFLKRNPKTNFVAYEDGRLVGAMLCGHDGRRGYIYHTVVLPDYRGKGIATDLVKSAVAALREEGITRVCLNVMETILVPLDFFDVSHEARWNCVPQFSCDFPVFTMFSIF